MRFMSDYKFTGICFIFCLTFFLLFVPEAYAANKYSTKQVIATLDKLHKAKEYKKVGSYINGIFAEEESKISGDTFMEVFEWLNQNYVEDDLNTLYGMTYQNLIFSVLKHGKRDTPKEQVWLAFGLTKFYSSALSIEGHILRCADKTAGQLLRRKFYGLKKQREKDFKTLDPELQKPVILAVENARKFEKTRKVNLDYCRDGIQHMTRVLQSKKYKTKEIKSPEHLGGKVQHIQSDLKPRIVSNDVWKERLDKTYVSWLKPLYDIAEQNKTAKGAFSETVPMKAGDITVPYPDGYLEMLRYIPFFKKIVAGMAGKQNPLALYGFVPDENFASYLLEGDAGALIDTKIGFSVFMIDEDKQRTDFDYKLFQSNLRKKQKAIADSAMDRLGSRVEDGLSAVGVTDVSANYKYSMKPVTTEIVEKKNYFETGYVSGMAFNIKAMGHEAKSDDKTVMEMAIVPINGYFAFFVTASDYTGEDSVVKAQKAIRGWADRVVAANAQYPRTLTSDVTKGTYIAMAIVVLIFLYFLVLRPVSKPAPADRTIASHGQTEAFSKTDTLSASQPIERLQESSRLQEFLSRHPAYEKTIKQKLFYGALFLHNAAYLTIAGLAYKATDEINYTVFFVGLCALANMFAVIWGAHLSLYKKKFLNGTTMILNVMALLFLVYEPLVDTNYTALICTVLMFIYPFKAPYSVKKERAVFVFNILKSGKTENPESWGELNNEMRSGADYKYFRKELYHYKLARNEEMEQFKIALGQCFKTEHTKPQAWVTEYLHNNLDTIALLSLCGIPPEKAAWIIVHDPFYK